MKTFWMTIILGLTLFCTVTIKVHQANAQNPLPPAPPSFVTPSVKEPTIIKPLSSWISTDTQGNLDSQKNATNHSRGVTNSYIAARPRIYCFKKECTECTNIVTSTNYHITKRDSVKNLKEYTILFHCNECGEDFYDSIELPMKHTKVEMVTVQTVK